MIRNIPVQPEPLGLVAAGPCEPVAVWEDQNGRRVMTDKQATNDDGTLLWTAFLMSSASGRPEVLQVQVPAPQQPVLQQFGAVHIDGLEVRVAVDKSGRLAGYWSATAIRDAGQSKRQHNAEHAA